MKEEMMEKEIENRNRGEGRIMERPILTEKDLVRIVNKQKSRKAAGVDGVKAEAMKQMIKNKKIRESLVRAFNCSLDEKVNRRWLESRTTMIPKTNRPQYKDHSGNSVE